MVEPVVARWRLVARALCVAIFALSGCLESGSGENALSFKPDASAGDAARDPDPLARADVQALLRTTEGLVREAAGLDERTRGALLDALQQAREALRRGDFATASTLVLGMLERLEAARLADVDAATRLYVAVHGLAESIIAWGRDEGARLGRGSEAFGGRSGWRMLDGATPERMAFRLTFPEPALTVTTLDRRAYADVRIDGAVAVAGAPGAPNVPRVATLLALPIGGQASVRVTATPGRRVMPIRTGPIIDEGLVQAEPPTGTALFPPPQAIVDPRSYRGTTPRDLCRVDAIGTFRDTPLAVVTCAAGQFDADRSRLTLFSAVELEIVVEGSTGAYFTQRALGGFEPTEWVVGMVANADLVNTRALADVTIDPDLPPFVPGLPDCLSGDAQGESLLILTTPDLYGAAETLAELRRITGVPTSILAVNDGAGPAPDSPEEIDAIIERRWQTCGIRPQWVLIFGDTDRVPTFSLVTLTTDDRLDPGPLGSDAPYGNVGALELIPDIIVGRIPVDSAVAADQVLARLLAYHWISSEQPQAFFDAVASLAVFECCKVPDPEPLAVKLATLPGTARREFQNVGEQISLGHEADGRQVERLYSLTISEDYQANPAPAYDQARRRLPTSLRPESGFEWHTDEAGAVADLLSGLAPSVVSYMGHGWRGGFGSPRLTRPTIASFDEDGRHPLVIAFTCTAGLFDDEQHPEVADPSETYFIEQLIVGDDAGYNAIAALSDSRVAYSYWATLAALAAHDGLSPAVLSDFGGARRAGSVGELMLRAHAYMAMNAPAPPVANLDAPLPGRSEYMRAITLLMGDPSVRLHRDAVPDFDVQIAYWQGYSASVPTPSLIEAAGNDPAWWDAGEPTPGDGRIWGPDDVDPSAYEFAADNPAIVRWVGAGFTVLGLPAGTRVVATTTPRFEETMWLGAGESDGVRADVTFVSEGRGIDPELVAIWAQFESGISALLAGNSDASRVLEDPGEFRQDDGVIDLVEGLSPELRDPGAVQSFYDATPDARALGFANIYGYEDTPEETQFVPTPDGGELHVPLQAARLVAFQFESPDYVRRAGLFVSSESGAPLTITWEATVIGGLYYPNGRLTVDAVPTFIGVEAAAPIEGLRFRVQGQAGVLVFRELHVGVAP